MPATLRWIPHQYCRRRLRSRNLRTQLSMFVIELCQYFLVSGIAAQDLEKVRIVPGVVRCTVSDSLCEPKDRLFAIALQGEEGGNFVLNTRRFPAWRKFEFAPPRAFLTCRALGFLRATDDSTGTTTRACASVGWLASVRWSPIAYGTNALSSSMELS